MIKIIDEIEDYLDEIQEEEPSLQDDSSSCISSR